MKPRSFVLPVTLSLLVCCVGGCGSKSDGSALAPVEGTVTFQGKPLGNAQVIFMPETPGLLPAQGMTDSSGRYELTTIVPGDGANISKHRVTITARAEGTPLAKGEVWTPEMAMGDGKALIPEKYFNADTSGLTAEVTPDGLTADFDLKD